MACVAFHFNLTLVDTRTLAASDRLPRRRPGALNYGLSPWSPGPLWLAEDLAEPDAERVWRRARTAPDVPWAPS